MGLLQWCDVSEWSSLARTLPVIQEFVDVHDPPLVYQGEGAPGQRAANESSRANIDHCLVAAVLRVEMRRMMVFPIKRNGNSEKPAYDWRFT
jgi:hypothetical protein